MENTARISATTEAIALIRGLQATHGALMFHMSGGCCDGSAPMCFKANEFKAGYSDVGLGYIEGSPFWMSKDQFDYWQHTQLCLDVVRGRGSSFSLEIPSGLRFIIRSRIFTEDELNRLTPLFYRTDD